MKHIEVTYFRISSYKEKIDYKTTNGWHTAAWHGELSGFARRRITDIGTFTNLRVMLW